MSNDNRRTDEASLIERAAEIYDFGAALRGRGVAVPVVEDPSQPAVTPAEAGAAVVDSAPLPKPAPASAGATHARSVATIDRTLLRDNGFIIPDSLIDTLAEEFRLVKRQLLLRATAQPGERTAKDRMILVCSAQPNEGKTFCAVNLALSLASERDSEVLLVDADIANPQVLSTLGLASSGGLIDAIADPSLNVERLIIQTDIPKLSVLPAGKATNDDTELLSSARAAEIMAGLATANERRIIIIDSAPALAASPAAVLAHRVGRILMVVRADRTTESDLQEAIALLDGCDDISLLLNGASFFGTNRTYGSYYGSDQS
jgi:exopolysaccharide/PEP-CTERM locus tyrosine autokinase